VRRLGDGGHGLGERGRMLRMGERTARAADLSLPMEDRQGRRGISTRSSSTIMLRGDLTGLDAPAP